MKSRIISISAISASLVALCLILGSYVSFVDVFCTIIASVFVILPLYYKSFKGCFLTYLAGGLVATLASLPSLAYSFVLPAYFIFFGLFPIIRNLLSHKNVNKVLSFFIGLVWCVVSLYAVYFYYVLVLGLNLSDLPFVVEKYILIFIGVFSVVFYLIYDRFIFVVKLLMDRYLKKIIK